MNETVRSVNVRTLAEVYFEGGDLGADGGIDRMQEGLKGHLLLQKAYPEGYRSEAPVRIEREVSGIPLIVQGRIDGLLLADGQALVEEIKTTRRPPARVSERDYPVHWAQAEIYAYILAENENLPEVTVRLTYADLSGARASFTRPYTREKLTALFFLYAEAYARRLRFFDEWKETSLPSMRALGFPFAGFREGQRTMAAQIYRTIRDKKKILVEAPTGIGKTAGALFPAVKALGEGRVETVFYLTARTTGRRAAEDALNRMREGGLMIRSVTITAKSKICPVPGTRCDPEACLYARGYFDRQKKAVEEAWRTPGLDREAVLALAKKHRLCPFELSLALAETAEVVVCDYNYVFDPVVRLKRFFDHRGSYALLIDEAHNLIPRAREMYSAELSAKNVRTLRREVGKCEGRLSPLYAACTRFLKSFEHAEECELRSELPIALIDEAKPFLDALRDRLDSASPFHSLLLEEYFAVSAFLRVSGEFDEETYKTLIEPEGKRCRVRLWCWNPTQRLSRTMKRMRGTALFSATLTPIGHYARLFGISENDGDRTLSLPSPFPRENLLSLSMDIPTRYSAREESAPRVARAIAQLALAKRGNYAACFPSHAYLNQVAELFRAHYPNVRVLLQARDMNEDARNAYLAQFRENPETSMVAFIAMGGVFSEGVDLPGERLIGAAIVGVGLPQLCFERNSLAALYNDADGEGGFETAYVYPGFGKCLQAAGRVIRTPTDRGVTLFIDDRYAREDYQTLFPPHIRPAPVTEKTLANTLARFWGTKGQA